MQQSVTPKDVLVQLSECDGDDKRGVYTLAQAADILNVSRQRMRAWCRAGLVQPAINIGGIPYFDYQRVASAKTLCNLADAGVSTSQIRYGIERLREWLADPEEPLEQLVMLERNGRLLMRMEAGLVEPSGQLCFDFGAEHAVIEAQPTTVDEWFQLGCDHEEDGSLHEAIDAYRQALSLGGPDPDIYFNLANVLYATGQRAAAVERWRVAVELDPGHGEAWNNLGVALCQMGRRDEAKRALTRSANLNFVAAKHNLSLLARWLA